MGKLKSYKECYEILSFIILSIPVLPPLLTSDLLINQQMTRLKRVILSNGDGQIDLKNSDLISLTL